MVARCSVSRDGTASSPSLVPHKAVGLSPCCSMMKMARMASRTGLPSQNQDIVSHPNSPSNILTKSWTYKADLGGRRCVGSQSKAWLGFTGTLEDAGGEH